MLLIGSYVSCDSTNTLSDSDIIEIGNECIYAAVVSKSPLDDRLPE